MFTVKKTSQRSECALLNNTDTVNRLSRIVKTRMKGQICISTRQAREFPIVEWLKSSNTYLEE